MLAKDSVENCGTMNAITSFIEQEREAIGEIKVGVCFGLGTTSDEGDGKRNFLWELCIFLNVNRMLTGDKAPLYLQEPRFTSLDKDFLEKTLGLTVLDDPNAYDLIGPSSFIFMPFAPNFCVETMLKVAIPGLYIGPALKFAKNMSNTYRLPLAERLPFLENRGYDVEGENNEWPKWQVEGCKNSAITEEKWSDALNTLLGRTLPRFVNAGYWDICCRKEPLIEWLVERLDLG